MIPYDSNYCYSWGKNKSDDISISTHKCTLITELPKMLIITNYTFWKPFFCSYIWTVWVYSWEIEREGPLHNT